MHTEECWYIKRSLQVQPNGQSGSVELVVVIRHDNWFIFTALSVGDTQASGVSTPVTPKLLLPKTEASFSTQKRGGASFTVHLFPDGNSLVAQALRLRCCVDFNSSSDTVGNKSVNAVHFQPVHEERDKMASEGHTSKTNVNREECFGKKKKKVAAIILARTDPKI